MNPRVNDRSDHYAADTLENRLRFTLEAVDAVVARIGADKVGIRLSPYGQLFDMPLYPEIEATYLALAHELSQRKLVYVHIMDQSGHAASTGPSPVPKDFLTRFRAALTHGALILAGGQTQESADRLIGAGTLDLVAFGQPFISNPDLVERMENSWPLAEPDKATYYSGAEQGYIDYPTYAETALLAHA